MGNGTVCRVKGAMIVCFPEGKTEEIDGILVKRPAQSVIAFKKEPFFAEILKPAWVDVPNHPHAETMQRYYGAYQDYDDIQAGASIQLIGTEYWTPDAEIGKSFYGLIKHVDAATGSDVLKQKPLITDEKGQALRLHLGYYLSWPVDQIIEFDCDDDISQMLTSLPGEKSRRILDYLKTKV
ncbi:hypothetical protein KY329_03290 [Candidatus Woesearchaeota archaeon]|nr:hypothetical protein [Candidatus Woesearchaeota archaeon]